MAESADTGHVARTLAYALVVLAVIAVPFARNGYALATMVVIGQNALAALGLSLMIGTAGEVVLAQAAFFGLGAYAAAAASRHGVDPWLAIGVAALVGAAVAALVGWPTLRLRGHYLTLATLGLGVIAKVVFDEAGGLTGGPSGIGDFGALHFGAQALHGDLPAYVVAWVAVGLGAAGLSALRASARGRALRAIAASEAAAAAMGVRVRTRKLEAFVLSAVYAAVAGSLYAYYAGYISPTSFTFEQSVFFVVMVVLGGAATALGPIVGAALFTLRRDRADGAGRRGVSGQRAGRRGGAAGRRVRRDPRRGDALRAAGARRRAAGARGVSMRKRGMSTRGALGERYRERFRRSVNEASTVAAARGGARAQAVRRASSRSTTSRSRSSPVRSSRSSGPTGPARPASST